MIICKVVTKHYSKKEGTKTVFSLDSEQESFLDSDLIESRYVDSMSFFKNLGGSESLKRCYSVAGLMPYLLTSKSPDRESKTIREFRYIDCKRYYSKRITRFIDPSSKLYYGFRNNIGQETIFDEPKKATKQQMTSKY